VEKEDVIPYITDLIDLVSGEFHQDLIMNMDESGFYQRTLKGFQKNCVFLRSADIKPRFIEAPDANHILIVGAVTLSSRSLQPLLLSTQVHLPAEMRIFYLQHEFQYYYTPKGYLTGDAMDHWVDHVLIPYVVCARQQFGRNFRGFLLLDGFKAHCTPHVRERFQQENVIVIMLPPHASHLYQVLDLCLFGVMKKEYKSSRIHGKCPSSDEKSTQRSSEF
jgi:hypothetical protein